MDRETYDKIKKEIQDVYDRKMRALNELAGDDVPSEETETEKPKTVSRQKSTETSGSMRVLNTIKSNGVHPAQEETKVRNRPSKTVMCEFPECTHRVHADNPACVECSKKVCALHKRGDVCKLCKDRP